MIVRQCIGQPGISPTLSDCLAFKALNPGYDLFAIIDGAINPELLPRLERFWGVDEWASLYAELPEGKAPEVTPIAIPLLAHMDGKTEKRLSSVTKTHVLTEESVILVWSNLNLRATARHLGRHAVVTTAENKRAILRFHDPAILAAALTVQSESERQHFFSPLAAVWVADLDGTWWSLSLEQKRAEPDAGSVPWTQFRHIRFQRLTLPRKILLKLETEYPEKLSGSRVGWLERIDKWLDNSNQYPINSQTEYYLYCVTALFAGENFAADPDVKSVLAAIGSTYKNFASAIQAVPAEVWSRLESSAAH